MPSWRVEYLDAYRAWVLRHRPEMDEELALVGLFDEWARVGPPEDAVLDEKENLSVRSGPVTVMFRRFPAAGDPAGYVLVLEVR